jgi:NAD(P)-dependent dehydrogenase (short-subunit alcohol dehydrogenase family)
VTALLLPLLLLLQTIAKEWGHVNVRCNAIAYGMIDTRLTRAKEGGEAISIAGEKVHTPCNHQSAAMLFMIFMQLSARKP